MNRDAEHLRLLSIFHYVLAALSALLTLFPVLYLGAGAVLLLGRFGAGGTPDAPRELGWLFLGVGATLFLIGITFSICVAFAGWYVSRREHHTYCLVVAAFECLFVPHGTVLGVLTLIVLQRESVRRLFGSATSPPSPAAT